MYTVLQLMILLMKWWLLWKCPPIMNIVRCFFLHMVVELQAHLFIHLV